MHLFDPTYYWSWADRLRPSTWSPTVLETLGWQLAAILIVYFLAWILRVTTRPWFARVAGTVAARYPVLRLPSGLRRLGVFCYAWLLLIVAGRAFEHLGYDYRLIGIAASLTGLWIVIQASSLLLRDPVLARGVAAVAWIVAALDITGLLLPTEAALDSLALTFGTVRISVLLVLKAVLIVAILIWIAVALARLIDARLQHAAALSPSVRALSSNLARIVLMTVALLIGLDLVGIDLTGFAVFSGAVGVGLGFGLQKIVSNFVSGIILLLERSIKPGDVIEAGDTFGSVTYLGARYASVRGRDGKEYLIPNENLITNQVVNWSYSNSLVRLHAEFGVAYSSDLHAVREVAIDVAKQTRRVLAWPAPLCHVTGFGDSAVNMLLLFWIDDPVNGVINIKGDVLLALWDAFHKHNIEFPFPQRDVHIRDLPRAAFSRAAE
ncbi:MAG TPA: mechanosensitive ion channel domain-containing protein [Stellaceae bacterium]|nr:mechanosensitive ion channel domain-containing protein [Stellaceae bacterium]